MGASAPMHHSFEIRGAEWCIMRMSKEEHHTWRKPSRPHATQGGTNSLTREGVTK